MIRVEYSAKEIHIYQVGFIDIYDNPDSANPLRLTLNKNLLIK